MAGTMKPNQLSGCFEADPLWTFGWTCGANILLDNGKKDKAREIIERGMTTVESSIKTTELQFFYQNAEAVFKRLGETQRAEYCAKKGRELASEYSGDFEPPNPMYRATNYDDKSHLLKNIVPM
ncbi:MAG: hypothetical protein ACYCYI_03220 [Saccharofermentanales bacterium]